MDSTTSDIPREVADIIIDLNIIKHIPTNHKLNVNNKTYVNADSMIGGIWRWWHEETGDTTVDFINKTIDEAVKVCQKYPAWIDYIANNVSEISNALLNLDQIYKRLNQEATVGRIGLIGVRIHKERFFRACQRPIQTSSPIAILPSTQVATSVQTSSPIPVNSDPNSLHCHSCTNCSKGLIHNLESSPDGHDPK